MGGEGGRGGMWWVTVLEATGSIQKHKAPSSSGPSLGSHSTPSSPPPALTPLAPPGLGFIDNLSALGGRPASPEPLKSALGVPKPQPGCWSQGLCRPRKAAPTNSARLPEGTVPPRGLSVAQQGQHCPQACPGHARAICPFSSWPSSPSASSHVWGFCFSFSLSAPP